MLEPEQITIEKFLTGIEKYIIWKNQVLHTSYINFYCCAATNKKGGLIFILIVCHSVGTDKSSTENSTT